MSKTRLILFLAVLAFVGHILFVYFGLPPNVASHFDGQGNPNGWMSKSTFLLFELGVLVFVVGQFLLVPFFVGRLPPSLVNMPNRDYWLSDEHKEETLEIFRGYFEVFGTGIILLLIVVNQMVYSANIARANLSSSIWVVIVAFVVFAIVWLIKFMSEFRLNK